MPYLPRHKHDTGSGLAAYAALLFAAIAGLVLLKMPRSAIDGPSRPATEVAARDGHSDGIIVIPREVGGGCRQMKFDTGTGAVREGATVPCPYEVAGDRGIAIQNTFSKR